ncbi:MAG: hypothetical protein P4L53_09125 [Candidatus Obscuribacterales bacterium]|nr:hypothetical protein [Candidatus Obscuribacterales bacterium]
MKDKIESLLANEILKAVLFVSLPFALAVFMGAVWGLVDWLRTYGSGTAAFPYFDQSQSGLEFHNRYQPGTFFGFVETAVNWYNMSFRGGTRFGSGLGFMGGAFLVMGFYKERKVFVRTVAGMTVGAEIGARFALNLGSGVPLFLVGVTVGAIIGGLYMSFGAAPSKAKTLPLKVLSQV